MATESFEPGDRVVWRPRIRGEATSPIVATVLGVTARRVKIAAPSETGGETIVRHVAATSLTRHGVQSQGDQPASESGEVDRLAGPGIGVLRPTRAARPEVDEDREFRIRMEIVVDANGGDEQAMGWYYYLSDQLRVPFHARCVRERASSPLSAGERVTVIGMPDEEVCGREMFVTIRWGRRELAVPLAQLEAVGVAIDSETLEAIADWHYWVDRGYEF